MTSSRAWSAALAVGAALVFAFALGTANGVLVVVQHRFGWTSTAARLLQAAACPALTAVGVLLLTRRHRRPLSWVGLRGGRPGADLGTGVVVVLTAALLVIGPTLAAGGLWLRSVDPGTLLVFLLVTLLVATGLEAFPEELAFRGLAFSALRERASRRLAGLGMTVLFVLSPGASTLVSTAIIRAADAGRPSWYAVAPDGEDPVVYVVFLVLWSGCLLAARWATGSLWTSMAAHLSMLVVNRLILGSGTGVTVQLADPSVLLILPAYVVLAALGFVGLRAYRVRRDRSGVLTHGVLPRA